MEGMQSQMKSGEVNDYYNDDKLLGDTYKTGDFIRCYLISAIQFAISVENKKTVIEAINKNPRLKFKFDTLMRAIIDGKLPLPREYSLDEMVYVSRDGMPRVKVAKSSRHTMDEFNNLNWNGNRNSTGEDPLPSKASGHRLHNRNTGPSPREPQPVVAEEGRPATATATATAAATTAALPPPPPFAAFPNEPQPVVGGARKTHRKRRTNRNRSRSRRSRSNRH